MSAVLSQLAPSESAKAEFEAGVVRITVNLVAARAIRGRWPLVGVLVLSQYVETEYALRLLEGNDERCGYLLKDRVLDGDQLADAVAASAKAGWSSTRSS
jgi:hypothetical protein